MPRTSTASGTPRHRKTINVSVIPHERQRYPTVGDYWGTPTRLQVRVSDMDNWKYEACVALHELVELWLCRNAGISHRLIDAYDIAYEARRKPGDLSEPGDAPDCPYRTQHRFATHVERLFATELGVDWSEYSKCVESL